MQPTALQGYPYTLSRQVQWKGRGLPCQHRSNRVQQAAATAAAAAVQNTPVQERPSVSEMRIPRSLAEIDNGKILGFGADLAEDHPGYGDAAYKQRRMEIANRARGFQVGDPIPGLDYLPEEKGTWAKVLSELQQLFPTHACQEFNHNFPLFGFRGDHVPQLEDMARVLRQHTGWGIRPVAGLLHPRDFLNGLAFNTFHSTQYMRHHSKPMYTPEPDVCHELIGHVPMLADAAYCDLVHTIGVASLAANEKQIWHLTKIYWYTVEFGVVREDGEIRAFGAGVLSSYEELQHMRSGHVHFEPFDPFKPQPKMSYKDGVQKRLFVMDSFQDGADKLREYCRSITPPGVYAEHMARRNSNGRH